MNFLIVLIAILFVFGVNVFYFVKFCKIRYPGKSILKIWLSHPLVGFEILKHKPIYAMIQLASFIILVFFLLYIEFDFWGLR